MSDAHPNPTANNQDQLAELLRGPAVSARPEFRADLRHQLMNMQVPPPAPEATVAKTTEVTRWLIGVLVATVAVGVTLVATGLPFQGSAPADEPVPAALEPESGYDASADGADGAADMDGAGQPSQVDPSQVDPGQADPNFVTPTPAEDDAADSSPANRNAAGDQQRNQPAEPVRPQATNTALPADPPTNQPSNGDDGSGGDPDPGRGSDDDPTAPPASATPEPTSTRDLRTPSTPLPTNTAEPTPGPRVTATPGSPTPETNAQDERSPVDP